MADTAHLLALIQRAVQRAAEGDHVGAVVSGGIDSSTVACLGPDLPTFTGYYEGDGFDEREYARLVRGSEHHEILITPQDFVDNFDLMVPHLEPPYQGMGTFGQYMVGKYMAAQGIKVALSGEGADELFGGYARLRLVAGVYPPVGYRDYKLPDDYPRDLEAALAYDMARLPLLLAVDDQCMRAHGVEARAPFADPTVVNYVQTMVPAKERVAKRLLKETVRGIVPDMILTRRDKRGFPIPLVAWAQEEPVRSFVLGRLGYLPDPDRPWDRAWWHELIERSTAAELAA